MIDFLKTPGMQGILIGVLTFLIIGLFHPIVIKAEYYFSKKIWWLFLLLGIVFLIAAFFSKTIFVAVILAILGVTCIWSIKEIKEQEERVRKGWFPKNPKRKY